MTDSTTIVPEEELDFATLLEESFSKPLPEQGDIVNGTILVIDQQGMLVDIGLKKDGMVTKQDLERLGPDVRFEVGQEVPVMITRMEDRNGNLIVSLSQAIQAEDWVRAEELMEADEIYNGLVVDANRGGIIIQFGNLRGFVPASHVMSIPRNLSEAERQQAMKRLINTEIPVKIIEVNQKRRRLVFSQREAMREQRANIKEQLMEELKEGEVRKGIVSGLRDFGAFVDLGGADGLIHISELAWHRVQHPREILNVGDEVSVYVMHLDQTDRRIGLSLKRLQENPWVQVDEMYHIGQLVLGEVSRVANYGAFIRLEPGIEALLHSSQISDPAPEDVQTVLQPDRYLLLRIISIESDRQRLGLSYVDVTDSEREVYAKEHNLSVEEISIDPALLPTEAPSEGDENSVE
ncbi:MAG: 30S ribosomal protein S1 [Phototrophicales bacterium]|nr:MAG: 30S ribosomal protein S1 [Phototrophicales bacterium]